MKAVGTVLAVAIAIASSALGHLSGWLTGHSGPHETVVAATIPAILSIGGGVIVLRGTSNGNPLRVAQVTVFIVAFRLFFRVGAYSGVQERQADALVNATQIDATQLRHLESCSKAEFFVNGARYALGLQPLSSVYFCRAVP